MARSTTLAVKIISDSRDASRGFRDAETKVAGFQRRLDGASAAAGRTAVGVAGLAYAAFQAASDLQQSGGAIQSVFAGQADAVDALARKAAEANGLSRNSYQELAAVIGSQLKNMGIAHDQLVPKTDRLIDLGADLAATFGGTTADAVQALSSLLRGETDPIERYGVTIKQADIQARLAAMGLNDLEGSAARTAQTQAVLALLSEQTGSSVGAFARELDTANGSLQVAKAKAEDAAAALGEALLPFVSQGATLLADFATWVQENSDVVGPLAIVFGSLAAAIWLVNFALMSSPIVWLAVAIAAIVAAVIIMYQKFEWFRDLVDTIGKVISFIFGSWVDLIKDIVEGIGNVASWVGGLFSASPTVAVQGGGGQLRGGPGTGGGGGGMIRWGGPGVGSALAAPQLPAQSVTNITINGALDPVAVGRQVDRVQRASGRVTGGRSVGLQGRRL